MRISKGIKTLKGAPAEIPNSNRRDLPGFFKEMGYRVGVEIGVQRGAFTRRLLKAGLRVYAVDPWMAYKDYWAFTGYQNHQNKVYEAARKNLAPFPNCVILKQKSMDAVKDFKDESIDFVYIDGHHGFKFVTEDIYEWSKKVKKGGCISGHDYAYGKISARQPYCLQVKYVVDAYTKAFDIKNWYVLGRKHKQFEGEKRDQYRSWLWIKK